MLRKTSQLALLRIQILGEEGIFEFQCYEITELITFELHRCAFKHNHVFSTKMIWKVLFNLVHIVKSQIAADLQKAKHGAIMHDRWSKFGTHYVTIFGQYNRTVMQNTGRMQKTVLVPASTLLAIQPMAGISENEETDTDGNIENESSNDDEEENEEATNQNEEATLFTAEVHAEFFTNVMKSYSVDIKDWALYQVKLHFFFAFMLCN